MPESAFSAKRKADIGTEFRGQVVGDIAAVQPEPCGIEAAAGQRRRKLPFGNRAPRLAIVGAIARLEERRVAAAGVEDEASGAKTDRRRQANLKSLQTVKVKIDLGDIEPPIGTAKPPHVEGVRQI